jgi:SNF2 family DNA or RNA helicase
MQNKIKFFDSFIEIQCDRNDTATQQLAAQIPCVHFNRIRTKYRTTIHNIDMVLELFRGITVDDLAKLPPYIQGVYENEMLRRFMTDELLKEGPVQDKEWRFRHQQLGYELAQINPRYGFFYDTRTGKTPMSLYIMHKDIERHPEHKWLVLCPLILIEEAWMEDAAHFFPDMKVVNLHGKTKAQRLKNFEKQGNVYIQNIESFISWQENIEKMNFYGCIVDESSTMKSNASKFGKAAVEYAQKVKRWYLLSGTPAPNGEHEYYRQLQSIDPFGVHQSFAQFKEYFFVNVSYNPQFEQLQLRPDRKDEFNELVKKYSIYVDKEDVLETPGRDFFECRYDMPEELTKQYKQLASKLYLELNEDETITATSAAAKMNKLNQVTSGFIINTEEQTTHLLSEYRFDALEEILNIHSCEQVLIWANYKQEFVEIKKRLGDTCAIVNGTVSLEEKQKAIRDFKNKRIQYLVANPASADKGLTLTNAHICIYFSMNYSYELYKQSMERIYGPIQKQPIRCKYYIMLANKSVDEAIYSAITKKGSISKAVLNHLKGGL